MLCRAARTTSSWLGLVPRALPGAGCSRSAQLLRVYASQSSSNASTPTTAPGPVRSYPQEPRVGVGVVAFRRPKQAGTPPDILLIQRAKPPNKGQWCFPGGSLELGETLAHCAAREMVEETGLELQNDPAQKDNPFCQTLQVPTPFAAVDVIDHDPQDPSKLRFHYAIVEVAALVADHHRDKEPQASDDAAGAMWVSVKEMETLQNLTPKCLEITHEALRRFEIISKPLS